MTDVETIAKSLTKAQRENLLLCAPDMSISGTGWLGTMRRLCDAGLTRRVRWRVMGQKRLTHSAEYHATPLGLAVRAHLSEIQS